MSSLLDPAFEIAQITRESLGKIIEAAASRAVGGYAPMFSVTDEQLGSALKTILAEVRHDEAERQVLKAWREGRVTVHPVKDA